MSLILGDVNGILRWLGQVGSKLGRLSITSRSNVADYGEQFGLEFLFGVFVLFEGLVRQRACKFRFIRFFIAARGLQINWNVKGCYKDAQNKGDVKDRQINLGGFFVGCFNFIA